MSDRRALPVETRKKQEMRGPMENKRNTFQVIIAHSIPEECQRLATLFEDSGVFSVCYTTHDGLDCLQEIVSRQPDLALVHAVLDGIDGLELLRRLEEFPLPNTKRLYLTNYSNYLTQHAALTGVDHCILTPCADEVLIQRARDLLMPPQVGVTSDEAINAHTAHILHLLSAPESEKGYFYAIDGVRILVRDPKLVMRRKVTTELYGGIAKLHGLPNSSQVERCLRTLTDHIFANNSAWRLELYFNLADVQHAHATNTAFLTAIARHVTLALRAKAENDTNRNVTL